MGFLDDAKSKLTKAVDDHGGQIASGLDKAGQLVDKKTKGKYTDKIHTGIGKAKDGLDKLDGKNDDIA
ncbi:MAG: hypothetical protein JWP74_3357 [Marmoricola sp.]|nr:hypothetical protein [Marmoricola sp.]